MKRRIGIVDYGVGNQGSVARCLRSLGHQPIVTSDRRRLSECDLLILPGVGAFPAAMHALREQRLESYLRSVVMDGMPILGICLGMQLLAEGSSEHGHTEGLGLIPGRVEPNPRIGWHIGWNALTAVRPLDLLRESNDASVYFNHGYFFHAPIEYQVAFADAGDRVVAIVKRGNVIGFQFHPEKSQVAGSRLMAAAIDGMCE